jgi:hypothetical protein
MRNYIGVGRFGAVQNVAYTTTAGTIASGIGLGCTVVRVVATTDCYIKVDKSPTATTSDVLLPASDPEYIIVNPGEKISAIQVSSGGTLNVTEVS